jgi:excisionase family DNA binding protein
MPIPNSPRRPESEPLLTPQEVATMFRVDSKTVTRWAKAGKLTCIRTLGGHRRYREAEVRALLAGVPVGEIVPEGTCRECRYPLDSPGHRTATHPSRAA